MNYKEILGHIENNFTDKQLLKIYSEIGDIIEARENDDLESNSKYDYD